MILDAILEHKREEVAARKRAAPLAEVRRQAEAMPPPRDFASALAGPRLRLIAEVKRASPSKGPLRPDLDPAALASTYAAAGASALSVLTDQRFFQGSEADLQRARAASGLPTLRKDFTVDPYQVYEARALGADAVLLIAAALDQALLADLNALARALGLAALVEVHDEREVELALAAGATLVGVNNRDLRTFHTDLATTGRLRRLVPEGIPLVSESGIHRRADVEQVRQWGANAILVGEALVVSADPAAAIAELMGAGT